MPRYDYGCSVCGTVFEVIEGMNDEKVRECVRCGKAEARRKISRVNISVPSDRYLGPQERRKWYEATGKTPSTVAEVDSILKEKGLEYTGETLGNARFHVNPDGTKKE